MNKKKNWFSFVEIIVVVSLLAVISVSWGYYFHDFLENKQASIYTQNLQNYIHQLDTSLKSQDIYDYTADIKDWYIVVSKNNSWLDALLDFQTNNNQWEFLISSAWESDILFYSLYKNNKKIEEKNILATQTIPIEMNNNYSLSAKLNNQTINSYEIYYYDENEWLQIYDIIDNNNNRINSLRIENYWWKKYYKNAQNNTIIDTPVKIIFDMHWYEKTLILE